MGGCVRSGRWLPMLVLAAAVGCGDDDGGDGGDGGLSDVERCEAAAAAMAMACPDDGARTCAAMAYGASCAEGAAPGDLADAIDCLAASSSPGSCRSFADPSGAGDCVADVYAGASTADFDDILDDLRDVCESSFDPTTAMPPLFSRSPAELEAIRTCLDANTGSCALSRDCTASAAIVACFRER